MKFSSVIVFFLSLFVSVTTHATLIAEVGGVDNFIASITLKKSGDSTELNWAQDTLREKLDDQSITLTLDEKYDSNGDDWTLIEHPIENDIYSQKFQVNPSYFLLKFGIGGTDLNSHLLFENVGDLSFGVIDFSVAGIDLTKVKNFTIDRISHVNEFNSSPVIAPVTPTTPIPEPMTISLFGLAILGLVRYKK